VNDIPAMQLNLGRWQAALSIRPVIGVIVDAPLPTVLIENSRSIAAQCACLISRSIAPRRRSIRPRSTLASFLSRLRSAL
jgi:hypothetical protein